MAKYGKYGKQCRVPEKTLKELNRLILDCKKIGIYMKSQAQAFNLMAIKSYKGQMTKEEIINYLNSLEEKLG